MLPKGCKFSRSQRQGRATMGLGILIGPFSVTPLNTVLRLALGGAQAEPGERVRELSLRWCGPSPLRTLAVHRPCVRRRRSRRGGGAGGAAWQPLWGSGEQPPASGTGAAGGGPWAALQRVRTSRPICSSFSGYPRSTFRPKGCGWFEGQSDNCGRLLGLGPL